MKWPITSIGSICVPTAQRDPTVSPEVAFRYIDIASLDKDAKRITGATAMRGADAPSRARKEVRRGDVLVSTVRPNLNAVAMVPDEFDGQIASTGFCVLRANPELVDSRYIFFRCLTPDFVSFLVSQMRGANYPAVSDGVVKRAEIPLPAPKEQGRMIEMMEQADALRRQRGAADALAGRILPALFYKFFGDPVTNPKHWPRIRLGQFLEGIDSGWSPVCEARPASDGEWGVLKLGAVTTNRYLEAENKALPNTCAPLPEIEVHPGDLLFTRKNTRELVGACAYVRQTRSKLMLSDLIFRLRLRKEAQMNPVYLWALLTNPGKRHCIESLASGSAGSMPNISKTRLEGLEVEKADPVLQDKFADLALQMHAAEAKEQATRQSLEDLFAVLLHRAFTGDLTAKWRQAHVKELLAEMEHQARILGSGTKG